ncbi:hypothetical protein ABZW30_29615 [Kitasatospora sp. NPDC004669]|uniref:hypothetical protein n=1 Tax=Kitasatospora sp. NPDC004669 TaxID=3154555 RepID=UPI0033BDBA1B
MTCEHGLLGPVWWRLGRAGRHSLIEALDNPNTRAAYDQRQAVREREQQKAHRELMDSLACIDCGDVPEQESTWVYSGHKWTRRPHGRCRPCHRERKERLEREAEEQSVLVSRCRSAARSGGWSGTARAK